MWISVSPDAGMRLRLPDTHISMGDDAPAPYVARAGGNGGEPFEVGFTVDGYGGRLAVHCVGPPAPLTWVRGRGEGGRG